MDLQNTAQITNLCNDILHEIKNPGFSPLIAKNLFINLLIELEKELKDTQILALSGGFSAGDEPDGSAKFIANVLKAGNISDEVMNLQANRAEKDGE